MSLAVTVSGNSLLRRSNLIYVRGMTIGSGSIAERAGSHVDVGASSAAFCLSAEGALSMTASS